MEASEQQGQPNANDAEDAVGIAVLRCQAGGKRRICDHHGTLLVNAPSQGHNVSGTLAT